MASIPLLRLSLLPTSSRTTTTHHHHHRKPPPLSLHLLHPLKPLTLTTTTTTTKLKLKPKTSRTLSITSMSTTPATDRLISSVAYFLPFLNGLQYGRFLFAQFPSLTLLLQPILPIFSLYKTLPFASFAAFFGLYLGVVRNPAFSHYVRFNAMQALVLDVLLVLPTVLMRIFTPGQSGLGFKITVLCHNAVFVFLVLCFGYSWGCSILGRTPYLPFVADAAGRQLGG